MSLDPAGRKERLATIEQVCERLQDGELTPAEAATHILELVYELAQGGLE